MTSTSTSKKLINLLFLNDVSFPFVLGYLLAEGFSLTQSSIGGPEDDGSSLLTCLGQYPPCIRTTKFLCAENASETSKNCEPTIFFIIGKISGQIL